MTLRVERDGLDPRVLIVTIDRPALRNAVDSATATALADAFRDFDADDTLCVAILTGAGATFCAGADLKAFARGDLHRVEADGDGPMGPTRLVLSKPVIAAVEGHAVAGGLELAIWCDLRVAAVDATFGVYCRNVGVPLIDLGTVRLPRLIGQSRAMDLILTGRGVSGQEAYEMGLANRMVASGTALTAALELARSLCELPQQCMRNDRLSCLEQWGLTEAQATQVELRHGLNSLGSGESLRGAQDFANRCVNR